MVAVETALTGVKQEKMTENATLTPRQLRAVNALLTHPTVAAAAGVLGRDSNIDLGVISQ